jgi:hypothetical protein
VTRKERKSGKKIFYVENSGQNGLHYFNTNNVQKDTRSTIFFLTWRPMPLNKLRRKVRKSCSLQRGLQICCGPADLLAKQAGLQISFLQPALTSEKQKILLIQFILKN